ncbi:hypothetical protein RvY_19097-2 [Ramazzottius varieornatus]|uniref:Chromo domain-containing protein n=1 Tax=Ramazzottius varieornatus TaxID=947166 RepID=A0A1D1W895_RAMVA|nr:hypothetical protein RvY_19097-2 [Ramazzottius varieornatus]
MEELDAEGSTEGGTTSKLQERLHLLARIAGRRADDRRVTYLDRHPEVENFHHDRDFAQCLDRIRTDDIRCSAPSCRCKIPSRHAEGWRVRPSKPVREILSHQRHKDELWFLCQLASSQSGPELRKQCQVSTQLRQQYTDRLKLAGRSFQMSDVWNRQKEIEVREILHGELDSRQRLINDQLIQCQDTKEWADKTKNAKQLTNISVSAVRQAKNPGPMGRDEETGKKLYKVERILGVEWYQGKMWYLIKWEGWALEESTWEVNVQAEECVKYFYKMFGKPFDLKKKILSPEGDEFEAWEKEHKTLTPVKSKTRNGKTKSLKRKKDDTQTPKQIPDKTPMVSPESQAEPRSVQTIEIITLSDEETNEAAVPSVSARTNKADSSKGVSWESLGQSEASGSLEPKRRKHHGREKKAATSVKVEAILKSMRDVQGKKWYLVRWSGSTSGQSEWEAEKDLRDAKHGDAIELFISQTNDRRRTAPKHCMAKGTSHSSAH